jgi:hypothetical protein
VSTPPLSRFAAAPAPSDLVVLLEDRPGDALARGQVGSVVEVRADGVVVLFRDGAGAPIARVSVRPEALLKLRYGPVGR